MFIFKNFFMAWTKKVSVHKANLKKKIFSDKNYLKNTTDIWRSWANNSIYM